MTKYLLLAALSLSLPAICKESASKSWGHWLAETARETARVIIEEKIPVQVYGNYCGPQHGDGNYRLLPVDAVDRACMEHDRCYDSHYSSCACDARLVVDLQNAIVTADEWNYSHVVAGVIMAWFSKSECKCKDRLGYTRTLSSPLLSDKHMCRV